MKQDESFLSPATISEPVRKILTGIALFLAVCLIAVFGYVLAGWQIDDAVYMVIITIFGVGYGEVQPVQSTELRALTIVVIIAGYGAVIYTVGGFMQMLIDGEINKALGARRMSKEIGRLSGHTIICGFGRMGTILARELNKTSKPFVVIDNCETRLQYAAEQGYLLINGDATDEQILEKAGIHTAAVLASVLSEDAINVFVTITARAMNRQLSIIARGENPRTESKLLNSGADKVVLPTAIGASKVAQLIIRPTAEKILEQFVRQGELDEELAHIGLQFHELEVAAESTVAGKAIADIEVHSDHGFLIVGVRNAEGETILNPDAATRLGAGDVLIVLVHNDDIPSLSARFSAQGGKIMYRGVVANR